MRARMILALVGTASLTLGVYTACGGDDSVSTADAGKDTSVADTSVADTSVADTSIKDASCADVDLSALFNRDAAGTDSGAFGTCLSCLQANCSSAVMTCNGSCTCKNDIVTLGTCLGAGGDPMACAGGLLGDLTDPGVAALAGCVTGPCSICINGGGDAGKDSGAKDASDGGG